MKNINENRLKKVKLFLIYNITNKYGIRKITHSLACIRLFFSELGELKECDF